MTQCGWWWNSENLDQVFIKKIHRAFEKFHNFLSNYLVRIRNFRGSLINFQAFSRTLNNFKAFSMLLIFSKTRLELFSTSKTSWELLAQLLRLLKNFTQLNSLPDSFNFLKLPQQSPITSTNNFVNYVHLNSPENIQRDNPAALHWSPTQASPTDREHS